MLPPVPRFLDRYLTFDRRTLGLTRIFLGFYLICDGSEYPWRAKMRAPSFVNLQLMPELLRGYRMSDVIAILGSFDLVLGCVDR